MDQQTILTLTQVYNTIREIHVKGDDTLRMADCLRALLSVLSTHAKEQEARQNESPTT